MKQNTKQTRKQSTHIQHGSKVASIQQKIIRLKKESTQYYIHTIIGIYYDNYNIYYVAAAIAVLTTMHACIVSAELAYYVYWLLLFTFIHVASGSGGRN